MYNKYNFFKQKCTTWKQCILFKNKNIIKFFCKTGKIENILYIIYQTIFKYFIETNNTNVTLKTSKKFTLKSILQMHQNTYSAIRISK